MKISNTFFALMGATLLSANALADPKAPNLVDYDVNGDGIDEQAYELKSADDLYWFANLVNGKLVDVEQNKSANAVLTANITVNENLLESLVFDEKGNVTNEGLEAWFPIGYYNSDVDYVDYAGTFDGKGHTISGLYFNNDEQGYVGLFGQINGGATIKNVGVIDSYFSGYYEVGGVCGDNYNGTIENCYNTGKVSGGDGSYCIGGVCGYNVGTITNCYNSGEVSDGNESYYIGGVCGYNSKGTIENCYNTGKVSGGNESYYIGGVCGYNSKGTIENCYNTGKVSGGNESSSIGGVCGYNYEGTIENCYNSGEVSGGVNSEYIGGVCGYNCGSTIENCYNTGEVSGGNDSYSIGGVCGNNNGGTIENCYNTGEVSGGNDSYSIGGVCGNNNGGTIENCYNTGEVSGGDDFVGGVCGCNYNTITNCYDFKLNGGTLSGYSIVVKNNAIALPTEDMVSLKGYKFGGWYDNADCEGEAIISEEEFDDDEHILYAKWVENSTPTAIKAVEAESNKTIKTIKDGQIVIIRNGVMYDMQGRKL